MINNDNPNQRKANLLRKLHSKTLKAISLIIFETSLSKALSTNLIRNYRSIMSIIEKEANK